MVKTNHDALLEQKTHLMDQLTILSDSRKKDMADLTEKYAAIEETKGRIRKSDAQEKELWDQYKRISKQFNELPAP
jgi:hypothetical protein